MYKVILGILVCLGIVLYWLSTITEGEYYRSRSPDGQYSIYASRNKYFNFNLPFTRFGDAGGKIHLYDELENSVVSSSSIDMISYVDGDFYWSEDEVSMKAREAIDLPRHINIKALDHYYSSFPVKNSWDFFIEGITYKVNKEINELIVRNEAGDIVLRDITYIAQINNGFQVLNNTPAIAYYDAALNKLEHAPTAEMISNEYCGNVTTYGLKIEETEKYYILKKAVGFTSYNFTTYKSIDSVKKKNIKNIHFLNNKRKIAFNDNAPKEDYVIIDFGDYFGILSEEFGIAYFDTIDVTKRPIKTMRNGLYGYYNITPTKYIEINPFTYNLARFKDKKNNEGYVAIDGNEYYD
ncbi:hypothetical protein I2486_16285 [Cellulophaga sp. E16_2]|uniref:hypothetical protein n=1 Tax=Cellulophaga sp. E16_2 TaxID=2789297 RepID=UPI001A90E805|nr:hypothetical protein [Cellulophaga sp. E16_2]MBO0592964.1 hypothetical protein [Cellulophaga sp. E16_2]